MINGLLIGTAILGLIIWVLYKVGQANEKLGNMLWIIFLIMVLIANASLWGYLDYKVYLESKELQRQMTDLNEKYKTIKKVYDQAEKIIEYEKMYNVQDDIAEDIAYTIIYEAQKNGLESYLVTSIIAHESGFKTNAISPAGACGLTQMMPETWKEWGKGNIWDMRDNIRGGTRYLSHLYRRFGNERLALAAYNAGPSRKREIIIRRAAGYPDRVNRGRIRLAKGK